MQAHLDPKRNCQPKNKTQKAHSTAKASLCFPKSRMMNPADRASTMCLLTSLCARSKTIHSVARFSRTLAWHIDRINKTNLSIRLKVFEKTHSTHRQMMRRTSNLFRKLWLAIRETYNRATRCIALYTRPCSQGARKMMRILKTYCLASVCSMTAIARY